MNETDKKRFNRALSYALEELIKSAKCYGYAGAPEYLEVKDFLQQKQKQLQASFDKASKR